LELAVGCNRTNDVAIAFVSNDLKNYKIIIKLTQKLSSSNYILNKIITQKN